MTFRRFAVAAMAVLLAYPTSSYATEVYKWIDTNGVPNFSERPPEGVDYIKLDLRVAGPARSSQPKPPLNAWRSSTTSSAPTPEREQTTQPSAD